MSPTDWLTCSAKLRWCVLDIRVVSCSLVLGGKRWPDARHVHRLDQDTSGLVVMAMTAEAAREMCRQFREQGESEV